METAPRYRSVALGPKNIEVLTRDNGYTYVRSPEPLGGFPDRLTDKLIHWAGQAPERTYIAQREPGHGPWRRISYAQALQAARQIGQALLDRGLDADRPVLMLSGNDIEQALLALGCQFAGVPYSPISPAYSLVSKDYEKLRHVLEVVTPGLVFVSDAQTYGDAIRATIGTDIEITSTRPEQIDRPCTPFSQLMATPATPAVDAAQRATGPDTIVKFLFTSGSTSLPKAVINTQRMMCSNLKMMVLAWPFLSQEPPVLVDWLPWNHTFGGNHNLGMVLYNGGTLYIDEGKPTDQGMETTLRNLREIAPTVYFNVPIGWEKIANALEADEALRTMYYSRVRMQFYSGAALAQPVWDKLHATAEKACGERIVMTTGLGMTETSPSAMFVLDERALAGQIGHPLPGMEFKLVPNGDKVEVRYKGPNVTPGYWREPEKTAEAFDDEGFFCSGDAVKWLDPDDPGQGFVFDGRVAEDFKLDTGTWVNVGPLRAQVAREGAPYLQDSVITGHNRRELGVLIIPNLAQCRVLSGLPENAGAEAVLSSQPVRGFFQQLVTRLHGLGTGSSTRIARGLVLVEPPSLDRGEITDKGSINQRAVLSHRAPLVDALYNETDPGVLRPVQHS
ncbi:feruloyl-CoA synthase [Pusillimonas noertemannii]|uniref:Trans-feruloyl-CoA synthase n=1 Tax=Pusillimonas noertemannii TaxID=305977 RepID=A0A2U1CJ51_9BURK|nr:feruloyl-CoA synthase [Pusillimonas noertemannii]NYT70066.1 feruloyl-CoA synthase [Pusillimonas noertemannii]PVY61012.1 trans-feruloyl-CoA synthase [Pusillimonas noertemannii]TFL08334.1 feruloyl-CoA synthase [Pusillimonas noertemannii]